MTESWVLVGLGAGLLLFGFVAALAFQRWHVPDFLVLILLGVAIGPGGLHLAGPEHEAAIAAIAPTFMAVAVALILFEGGVRLPLRGMSKPFPRILVHAFAIMAVTLVATWWIGTRLFDVSTNAALLFGAATIGPSASIVVSVAPRLRLEPRVEWTVVAESVLSNVVSAVIVVGLVQFSAAEAALGGGNVLVSTTLTVLVALLVGAAWLQVTRRLSNTTFLYAATLGVALALYAIGSGLLDGSGALAAFVFGVVMGNRDVFDPVAWRKPATVAWDADLGRFHDETTFLVRTFLFVYLGFLFEVTGAVSRPLAFAVVLTVVYYAVRLPSTAALARSWDLPPRERRLLNAPLARGLTDAVLILYGIEAGLVAAAEASFLTDALVLLLIVSASATGVLIFVSERRARREAQDAEEERVSLTPDIPARFRLEGPRPP